MFWFADPSYMYNLQLPRILSLIFNQFTTPYNIAMHACSCSTCSMYASIQFLGLTLCYLNIYLAEASFSYSLKFSVMMHAWSGGMQQRQLCVSSCTGMEKKSMEACYADHVLVAVYTGMKTMETSSAA